MLQVSEPFRSMKLFSHVTDNCLRKTLEINDSSEDAICHALTVTSNALEEDKANVDIADKVLSARQEAYEDADHAWNQEGDGQKALDALKAFWG